MKLLLGAIVIVALMLAAACADPSTVSTDSNSDALTTTFVETDSGTVLCEGEIAESAPPQCDGPTVTNWDWDAVWGAAGEAGARWGDFCVTGSRDGQEFTLDTLPRPAGTCSGSEVVGSGMVMESRAPTTAGREHGPEFCLGAVALSYPPQCGGPAIPNWDWEKISIDYESVGSTKWVDVRLHGVYVDDEFILTRSPVGIDHADVVYEVEPHDSGPACDEPADGSEVTGADNDQLDAIARRARQLDGYGWSYVSYLDGIDFSLTDGVDVETQVFNSPVLYNVAVVGDLDAAERQLREVWDGPLCVIRAQRTAAELRVIESKVHEELGALFQGSYTRREQVHIDILIDLDGSIQSDLDERYGHEVVVLTPYLKPADPVVVN